LAVTFFYFIPPMAGQRVSRDDAMIRDGATLRRCAFIASSRETLCVFANLCAFA
jgi:hypothetical protein